MKITGIETHYEKDSGYRGSDGWLGWNSNFTGSIFYGFRIGFSPLHRTRWTIRRSAKRVGGLNRASCQRRFMPCRSATEYRPIVLHLRTLSDR